MMRRRRSHLLCCLLVFLVPACTPRSDWRPLFDGQSLTGWRGFRMDTVPGGWEVLDGALTRTGGGGDVITVDQFGDFELELEWRVAPCGNSGILFHVVETEEETYHSGPEMQVLDDACHPDGRSRLTAAGSNFGLHAAPAGVVRPAGEWNRARLRVRHDTVTHWLNDSLVVRYVLGTPAWDSLVRASKFAPWPAYGRAEHGHIALQDHGNRVAFRRIRIRELP